MIIEFSVDNFRSINEKQAISFASTSDKTSKELLTVGFKKDIRINKLITFYGPNASGKSNMLRALYTVFALLFKPYFTREEKVIYTPFALNIGKPTQMYVSFFSRSVKYDYSIKYCDTHIISEKLEYAPNNVISLFYERAFTSKDQPPKIEFGSTLQLSAKTKNDFITNTLNNHTVLSTFGKISADKDAKPIATLYNWIKKYVHNINGDGYRGLNDKLQEISQNKDKKQFFINALKQADLNIVDFHSKTLDKNDLLQDIKSSTFIKNISDEEIKNILSGKYYETLFTSSSAKGNFDISIDYQSIGTLKYINQLFLLYDMIEGNHIYFLDELGDDLHHDLLLYYLTQFIMNSKKSQLFFTTQDLQLLDEDFMRRDMVYLVDKATETAATTVKRASEFGLHKNLSLLNAYKAGRLGAKPSTGSPFIEK